ncbi:hypothetical protein C7H19_15090 [Aphanothece hegewaldii CCALA 016]|uniref:Uncharacterized protein n=1 Tax=Aphanothece hegewaldii CCALA 016 TaxID=2107694 RepID=A0A2T1LVI6_9CHRO|nr:hypothetical protein [Aphanothece hegewaldii]PSF35749.1 hypothetical protein C7H19_15090 [Aphanothece hegewaldii CCALA 016]
MNLDPHLFSLLNNLWISVRAIFSRDGQLAHVGLINSPNHSKIVLLDNIPKEQIGRFMEELIERFRAHTVITIAEAWMTEHPLNQERFEDNAPARIEIVSIIIQSKDGCWISSTPITRPELAIVHEPFVYIPSLAGNFAIRFPANNN